MTNNNQDHLRDLLSLCAEIISKYNKELSHVEDSELQLWDNFIDRVDGLSHTSKDGYIWSNVGLPNAIECISCGQISNVPKKPWIEITKGQINDECIKHSDNYDYAWAVEAVCKRNNGY